MKHGDANCPVSVNSISAPASVTSGNAFTLSCTENVGSIRSINPTFNGGTCVFSSWSGTTAYFSCTAAAVATTTTYTLGCSIDTAKSYASGTNPRTQSIIVNPTNCNGVIQSQCGAPTRPDCSWNPQCSGVFSSGASTGCYATPPAANYICRYGQCGATGPQGCDTTTVCYSGTGNCNTATCQCQCNAGTPTVCGSTCVNLNSNQNNCGACGVVCGTNQVCNIGSCFHCDQDNDGYNRTDSALCAYAVGQGDCNDNNLNIHPNLAENTGFCSDGYDNNCDGKADYDGFTSGAVPSHYGGTIMVGDLACPVSITSIQLPSGIPLNMKFLVNCTANVGSIRSIDVTLSAGVSCDNNANVLWTGAKMSFNCTTTVTSGTITCSVNTGKSASTPPASASASFTPAQVVNCDQDNDGFLRMDNPGVCGVGSDCNDNNNAIKPSAVEACNDNVDNNCNNEADYDGGNTGLHGDTACKVQVTAASAVSPACYGAQGKVFGSCTYNVRATSATARLLQGAQQVPCTINDWSGTTANFNCSTSGYVAGAASFNCSVNTAISYQNGGSTPQAVTLNGLNGVCGTEGVCGPNGACVICDADHDGFNRTDQVGVCSFAAGRGDCVDDPVGLPNNAGGYVAGNLIHPGAAQILGNGVSEDCSGCDPYAQMEWRGSLLNNFGQLTSGSVSVDNGPFTQMPGGVISLTVPYGKHNLTGDAPGYDRITTRDVMFNCSNPTLENISLSPAECHADCTKGGYCDYSCIGQKGCDWNASLGQTPQEKGNITTICGLASQGSQYTFNSTHSVNCCIGAIVPKTNLQAPLTIQGCSDQLIFRKITVTSNGKLYQLTVATYDKCD